MTVTFPRAIPAILDPVGLSFYLEPMIEVTPLRSGKQVAKDLGPNLWRAKYQGPPMGEADFGEIRGWYDSLTSTEVFLGYDVYREYPRAYRAGWGGLLVAGSPFNGTGQINTITGSKTVALKTLPIGLILGIGDYLAFDYGSGPSTALHRIVQGGTANSSGNVTVEVRPFVRVGWAADAVVYLYQPAARMLIVPGSWSEAVDGDRLGTVSFEAIQTL